MKAYILIQTKPGTSEKVVKAIKSRVKEVVSADSVYGRFDAVVVIEAESLEELRKIIYEMVEQHPNVIHTETLISIFHPADPELL